MVLKKTLGDFDSSDALTEQDFSKCLNEKPTLCRDLKANGNEKHLQIVHCGPYGMVVGDKH